MSEKNDKVIKDAQYRKGLSIAFFNATNNAIEIIKAEKFFEGNNINETAKIERIKFWRDWLLDEHLEYYAKVIANVGQNFVIKETFKKLKNTKSLEELKSVWLLLSADERQNDEVRNLVTVLKEKYENIQ